MYRTFPSILGAVVGQTCCLVMFVTINWTTPLAAQGPRDGFGENWVRTHPFTVMALSSNTFGNWDPVEYKAANMNTTLDWEKSLSMLTGSASVGLPWIYDVQANPGGLTPAIQTEVQDAYNTDPGGANGWLVWDEPSRLQMATAATVLDWIKLQYPSTLVFSNAKGYGDTTESYWGGPGAPVNWDYEDYLADFASMVRPDVFMFDIYPFTSGGGTQNPFYGAKLVSDAAKAANLPYWAFIQSFGDAIGKRVPSESDVRMQVFTNLTYGFKGIGYFTYEDAIGPAMVAPNGVPRPIYYDIQTLNPEIINIGERLKLLTHRDTAYVPGKTGVTPNPVPFSVTHWTTHQGNQDHHIMDMGVDLSKPGNDGAGKDLLFGTFRDDASQPYFLLTNVHHGPSLTAAQTELDTYVQFDWRVNEIIRISRATGQEEVIPLANNRLENRLPGGTGDLFRYGELAQPVVIQTNFLEDFEPTTSAGYTPGALLNTQNGWSVTPGPILPIGTGNPEFSGQFLNGAAVASGPDSTAYTNSAGISGGLDPTKIYTLSWDWKLDSKSDNQSLGFRGTGTSFPFVSNQVRDLAWITSQDLGQLRLLYEHQTEQEFVDFAFPTSLDDPIHFQIVIDGATNVIDPDEPLAGPKNWLYGIVDGVETRRLLISDAEMMDLNKIQLFTDNGPNRRFPLTDNIRLTTSIPSVVWDFDGDGDWTVGPNWSTNVDPNGIDHSATFGSAITAPTAITVSGARTVGSIKLDNVNTYSLTNLIQTLSLQTSMGSAAIDVVKGTHEIDMRVTAKSDTILDIAPDASLSFLQKLTVDPGKTFTLDGGGTAALLGSLTLSTGSELRVLDGELQTELFSVAGSTGTVHILADGIVSGSGLLPTVINDGVLSPGAAAGSMGFAPAIAAAVGSIDGSSVPASVPEPHAMTLLLWACLVPLRRRPQRR